MKTLKLIGAGLVVLGFSCLVGLIFASFWFFYFPLPNK